MQIHVPDMSCGHCKAAIESALTPLVSAIEVDLAAHQLRLQGANAAEVLRKLDEIGYPATVIAP